MYSFFLFFFCNPPDRAHKRMCFVQSVYDRMSYNYLHSIVTIYDVLTGRVLVSHQEPNIFQSAEALGMYDMQILLKASATTEYFIYVC